MVEQFRPGALLSGENPWQVEPIAGICDVGETPEVTVRRKAMEEAGCTLGHIVPACAYLVSPGRVDEIMSVFCGSVDNSAIGKPGGMELENEETIVHVLEFATCIEGMREQRSAYALIVLALQCGSHSTAKSSNRPGADALACEPPMRHLQDTDRRCDIVQLPDDLHE